MDGNEHSILLPKKTLDACLKFWLYLRKPQLWGFPGDQDGKESAYNAENTGLIPGSGDPLKKGEITHSQYSGAFLVAQSVKTPPAVRESWVRSLGWEDPVEEGMATQSSILAWRIPKD